MSELCFAILGTGFWSRFQLAGWREVPGARCIALYNRTRAKAEKLAAEFQIPSVYDNAEKLFANEKLDFVDIITDVDSHPSLVELAAKFRVPVICQKPMAPDLATAMRMVSSCHEAGVQFAIHENWRWQHPMRELKSILDGGEIGKVFRARIDFCSSFPVFDNQPFLRELEQFILTDIGSHILDLARFLFGESKSLYCRTQRIHKDIRGEDVATVIMGMTSGATVTCNMSYASRLENERFPETFLLIEGEKGSVELAPDFWLRVTTKAGTVARRCPPPYFSWADARYSLVHSSIVSCNTDLLRSLQTRTPAETSGDDNLKTMKLVFACYESATKNQVVTINS